MATTWSLERKAKQSQAIRQWQPWLKSTGAKTIEGKALVSRNAYKGGHRPLLRQLSRELAEECLYAQRLIVLTERLRLSTAANKYLNSFVDMLNC